jgi:drug/metabolite transporter (DMT)-like permease
MPLIPKRYDAAIGIVIGGVCLISLTFVAPVMGNRVGLILLRSSPPLFYGLGVLVVILGAVLIFAERNKGR